MYSGLYKLVANFNTTNRMSQKASKNSINKKNDIVTNIPSLIPEEKQESHIVFRKKMSVDKCTMTDLGSSNKKIDEASDQSYNCNNRHLQWIDPRLLKKHSFLSRQSFKKSLTAPCAEDSEYETEDESDTVVIGDYSQQYFFKILYYFGSASLFIVGTMCGFTLITLMLWKFFSDNNQPTIWRKELLLTKTFFYFIESFYNLLNSAINYAIRILSMTTSEVFSKEEKSNGWMSTIIEYIYQIW